MLRSAISAIVRRFHRQERGQVLVLTVILLTVFGGMVAIAVDLGTLTADRRDLQNYADAIALAASLELPDEAQAQAAATQWALNNDIDPSIMTVTITQQNLPSEPNPKVLVELERDHGFVFAPLIGISSAMVGAHAVAIKTSPSGGVHMVPIAVTEDALGACGANQCTIKYDAVNLEQGNSGPVRIDGPGNGNCNSSDNYCSGVINGSETTICAFGADTTWCNGDTEVDTQPGNLVGGTRKAITCRVTDLGDPGRDESTCDGVYTDDECHEFDDVFYDDPLDNDPDVYRMTQDCNPFIGGLYASSQPIIVPVICVVLSDGTCEGNFDSCTGTCEVRIVEFALFFLEGFANPGSCTGNDCEVVGRFVDVNQNIGLLAGTFDPTAFNQFVRLVE